MPSNYTATHLQLTEQAAPRKVVGAFLAAELGDTSWRDCTVEIIPGGVSNLTFFISSAAGDVVLRRPPLSNRLPTAHDMGREYRVMTALGGTSVPVPRTLALCTNDDVLGAHFYVMERVAGYIARDDLPSGYAENAAERQAIGNALIDVIADLHSLDPATIGLQTFGRPDGYLERQVRRWTAQWKATRHDGDLNDSELDRLGTRLGHSLPDAPSGPVVHGDYRLDNAVLDPTAPGKIAAVLDWELSTLGDPMADVGLFYIYWQDESDASNQFSAGTMPTATRLPGFPTRRDLLERYAARTGADLSLLPWYVALASFKLAVVVAGVSARSRANAMVGDGIAEMAARIAPLTAAGHAALDGDLA